jgi:hypothetical protein
LVSQQSAPSQQSGGQGCSQQAGGQAGQQPSLGTPPGVAPDMTNEKNRGKNGPNMI